MFSTTSREYGWTQLFICGENRKFSESTNGIDSVGGKKFTDISDFNLTRSKWVNDKYKKFYEKNGYLPEFFDVYNGIEVRDIAPTVSTRSNGAMGSGTVLVICDK